MRSCLCQLWRWRDMDTGSNGVHHMFSVCPLGLALAIVLGVIIDLNDQVEAIQISELPMLNLQLQLWDHDGKQGSINSHLGIRKGKHNAKTKPYIFHHG